MHFEPKLPRTSNGDLKLMASEASRDYRPPLFTPALDGLTVTRNARQRVEVLGTQESLRDPVCILSQHVLQFGKYRGQTIKRVLENDLGWVTCVMALVDLDDKETEAPLSRNKFRLLTYVKHFPEVKAQLLTKQRGIEEERSRRKQVTGLDFQVGPRELFGMGDRCDGPGGPGR